ncbi:MAG: GNAT family N-acetyltransferase [Defluviitaleaceae bacterium]|nr:GNAT family N-acetyltransferase [Defluviitaleaceae bacterium]
MIQLNENQYELLLRLLEEINFNTLFIRSVIAGHVEGKIYVDYLHCPKSFYAISKCGLSLLFGNPNNEQFNNSLFNYFTQKNELRIKDEWLQAYPCEWYPLIEKVVSVGKANRYSRLNFSFDKNEFYKNNADLYFDEYTIIPTTAEMFSSIKGTVSPSEFWCDEHQFLKTSTSFIIVIDGEPASTAFASYRHDNILEIGIETDEKYRGRGLAQIVCSRLIKYCIENNLEPMWSCRLENVASTNLAKRLGFKETMRLPYYHIPV